MALATQIYKLKPKQIKQLADTMLNASIVYQTGGNWREIIRRAKQRKVGLLRRIYDMLQHATQDEFDIMAASLASTAN